MSSTPFRNKEQTDGHIKPIFTYLKKHSCMKCSNELIIKKITHYQIKKGSIEARGKYLDFDLFRNPIDYTFRIFACTKCDNQLSIMDQFFIEKPYKKNRSRFDDYHTYLMSIDKKEGTNRYEEHLNSIEIQWKKSKKNIDLNKKSR